MAKIIEKWWWVGVILLLAGLYIWGVYNMFFHQDDLDWFILADRPTWSVMSAPIGDHVNYVWRVLLRSEWKIFHLFFPAYLAISVAIHGGVIWLLYKLAKLSSGRRDLASMAALLFTINTNWTESILWISGQTITITALFVLLAMVAMWNKRGEFVWQLLASWTSALAISMLGASVLVFGKLRRPTIVILVILGVIYKLWGTDGTPLEVSALWGWQVVQVWGAMLINSVIGRLLLPFDRYEVLRMVIVSTLMIYGLWINRSKLLGIWRDEWSRFLLWQLGIYNLVVAVGRAQYGVGIMRAERYTYLGLLLVLLIFVRVMRKATIGRWIWVVPILIVGQSVGLYSRARVYIQRPQQMRALFEEIQKTDPNNIDQEAYLPHFVLNDERLKYRDLLNLMKD